MSTFLNIDCGGETVTIEKTDDGDFIFHGWDEETEMAAIELGFEPSPCFAVWNAINDDRLNTELNEQVVYEGNVLFVKALIFAGADVHWMGDFTLQRAASHDRADLVKVLLDAGANIEASDSNGWTSLYYAALHCCTDTVTVLLRAGANIHAPSKKGWTPLSIAEKFGCINIVEILEDWIREHGE